MDAYDNNNENRLFFPLGAAILDLNETDLKSIVERSIDHLIKCGQIPVTERESTADALYVKNRSDFNEHSQVINRNSRSSAENLSIENFSRKSSVRKSLTKVFHVGVIENLHSYNTLNGSNLDTYNTLDDSKKKKDQGGGTNHSKLTIENEKNQNSLECKSPSYVEITNHLSKYPQGTEATAVLAGSVDYLLEPMVIFVRLADAVLMPQVTEASIPVRFLFIILGPRTSEKQFSKLGETISRLMSDENFHEAAYKTQSVHDLSAVAKNVILSPSNGVINSGFENDNSDPVYFVSKNQNDISSPNSRNSISPGIPEKRDPLHRTGKPFYGLYQDVKIRYSQYLSDIKDGFSPQVLSASIFIFFAALSPAITFGGMYSDQTDRYIGVGETLLVSSINGMIFAIFAAQPILIVGATGPLMIFDMSLLQFTTSMDLDFLAIRVWVGIWILLFGLSVAALEAVNIVKKFTKFTEEIFSTFVCFIFIYGAFDKLATIFKNHPLVSSSNSCFIDANDSRILYGQLVNGSLHNGTNEEGADVTDSEIYVNQPNTALLSMCLMIGTFLIAWKLKKFRNSKFLGRSVRRALGDFGVPIAIFLMVLLDVLIHDTYTDKLQMPKGLSPSNAEVRGWFINPFGVTKPLPTWCIFAACPAAFLLFILIFLEENICHLILSKPERCLKKGTGFHLDIVLSCLINTISGVLGAPFMGPACVRTIAHMSSLTVMSSPSPGESPKVVGCHEQRVSPFTVSLLVGLSVMLYSVLNHVPNAVLYGIFLYMGVSATAGIQFLERITLYFMPVKYHSDAPYVKNVSTRKMHAFTAIQIVMLAVLWAVKQSPAALAVPFVLICLIPLRLYVLHYIFTTEELVALDGADAHTPEEVANEEADFYETCHALPTQIDDDYIHHRHHHHS